MIRQIQINDCYPMLWFILSVEWCHIWMFQKYHNTTSTWPMEITIPLPLLEIGCCDLHSDDSPTEMVLILPGKYNNSHKTLIMIIVMVPWHCLNEYYLVNSWPRRCKLNWNLNFKWESARSKKICSEGDYFNTLRDSQNGRHFADLGDKGADWYLLFCCLTDTLKPTLQPSGPFSVSCSE